MTLPNNGGPAFPCEQGHTPDGTWNQSFDPGMSRRDYFAAKAMAALILTVSAGQHRITAGKTAAQSIAEDAYDVADAMLVASVATPEQPRP